MTSQHISTDNRAAPRPTSRRAQSGSFDVALAEAALDLAWPSLVQAAKDPSICGTHCLHVVVLDPTLPFGAASFEDSVLCERSVNKDAWDADYAFYARKKAELAWRTGLDGHVVVTQRPHLLAAEDVKSYGGVCLDGIVVGVSGAMPWYDEAFALMVAASLRALAKGAQG